MIFTTFKLQFHKSVHSFYTYRYVVAWPALAPHLDHINLIANCEELSTSVTTRIPTRRTSNLGKALGLLIQHLQVNEKTYVQEHV